MHNVDIDNIQVKECQDIEELVLLVAQLEKQCVSLQPLILQCGFTFTHSAACVVLLCLSVCLSIYVRHIVCRLVFDGLISLAFSLILSLNIYQFEMLTLPYLDLNKLS